MSIAQNHSNNTLCLYTYRLQRYISTTCSRPSLCFAGQIIEKPMCPSITDELHPCCESIPRDAAKDMKIEILNSLENSSKLCGIYNTADDYLNPWKVRIEWTKRATGKGSFHVLFRYLVQQQEMAKSVYAASETATKNSHYHWHFDHIRSFYIWSMHI